MVLTQLQLKWPNHSNHLLTRLTHLFKNEQLVDCTLMCNKHSLKVHRSVLAACSPYFERELQNNPSIVIKDMQFNVLQALIEFMYYGETRITEENLTSLIEAAKLFEVKGLSEMDIMTSNSSHIISSVVPDSSVEVINEIDNVQQAFDQAQSNNHQLPHPSAYENSNDMMVDNAYQPHSSRNFVVTPPQTESAQILLSLARSHSQKQFAPVENGFLSDKPSEHSINNNITFNEHNLLLNELNSSTPVVESKPENDNSKSLLAKLLTRNNQSSTKAKYDDNYKTLIENESEEKSKELQSGIILECPFLIETNDGNYVDVSVDNMLNVFENGEIFDANGKNVKIISKEEVCQVKNECEIENAVLEHIKRETAENEFKDDPEAVVLCKVNENGQVEKFVLSSADIKSLKEMNEHIAKERAERIEASPIAEVEIPVSNSSAPLITRIIDCGSKVENAISKLPFKRAGYLNVSTENEEHRIIDAALAVDTHHHENMFEELDNQFNMDCSIENIQRDYVAYEEASKNETQLEHNYYANAMKDEDEECVVISDNYDLRMMMMVEDSELENGGTGKSKRRTNSFQVIGAQDVYLNGYGTKTPKNNGTMILNGKCDLILNNDALMSSVLVPNNKKPNGTAKFRTFKSAQLPNSSNPLPFKSVKSATSFRSSQERKPKRTYKRKNLQERKRNGSLTLDSNFITENNLVEEIVVDEIS